MARSYTLDKTPVQTIAVCSLCGSRVAANDSPTAQRLITAHVRDSHGPHAATPKPVK